MDLKMRFSYINFAPACRATLPTRCAPRTDE
ncbi:hypothetical protein A2U01_0112423, partial [Trifolium medium]|nr:hypothetical protein [Trifolium medium]